jgi:hypothetical protein
MAKENGTQRLPKLLEKDKFYFYLLTILNCTFNVKQSYTTYLIFNHLLHIIGVMVTLIHGNILLLLFMSFAVACSSVGDTIGNFGVAFGIDAFLKHVELGIHLPDLAKEFWIILFRDLAKNSCVIKEVDLFALISIPVDKLNLNVI